MKAIAAFLLLLCHLSMSHGQQGTTTIPSVTSSSAAAPRVQAAARSIRRRPSWPVSTTPPVLSSRWNCREAPRLYGIQQIETGLGKVVARDSNNYAYLLFGRNWLRMGYTRMRDLSVGPVGLWGCSLSGRVYKCVTGNFVPASGLSMQMVNAGGHQLVGVTRSNSAYCLRSRSALTYNGMGSLRWTSLGQRLRQYSCSPDNGCWGVALNYNVYYTQTTNGATCSFSGWRQVAGIRMRMVKAGSDGNLFAVGINGKLYTRIGFTRSRPYGSSWRLIPMCATIRHVSYDLRQLWVVTSSGIPLQCRNW